MTLIVELVSILREGIQMSSFKTFIPFGVLFPSALLLGIQIEASVANHLALRDHPVME